MNENVHNLEQLRKLKYTFLSRNSLNYIGEVINTIFLSLPLNNYQMFHHLLQFHLNII